MSPAVAGAASPAEHPEPTLDELRALAGDGQVAVLPVTLLEPGQVLLIPCAQILRVQSPPHAHGDIQVQVANSIAWVHFTPESWAPVFIPDGFSEDCGTCWNNWLEGCEPGCTARRIPEIDTAKALAAAGLTGPWSADEILAATS
jgi:hypothetical protein